MAITRVSHIGICVTEIEKSLRFYCDVLGFKPVVRIWGVNHADVARLLELEDLSMELVFVEWDGTRIELIQIESPAPSGGGKGPFNRVGFTHLSVMVADFDSELDRLRKAGVALLDHTIGASPDSNARFAFLLDPDGNRIELFGAPDGSPGGPVYVMMFTGGEEKAA